VELGPLAGGDHAYRCGEAGGEAGLLRDVHLCRARQLGELGQRGRLGWDLGRLADGHGAGHLAGDLPVDRPRRRQHPHELGEVEAARPHAREREAGKSERLERILRASAGVGVAARPAHRVVVPIGTVVVALSWALRRWDHAVSLWTCPLLPSRVPQG
jgi:hypothetical protein